MERRWSSRRRSGWQHNRFVEDLWLWKKKSGVATLVLLERALQRLNVPHELLVFPGENHPLDKNPWHGYIKVREELKWLARCGRK